MKNNTPSNTHNHLSKNLVSRIRATTPMLLIGLALTSCIIEEEMISVTYKVRNLSGEPATVTVVDYNTTEKFVAETQESVEIYVGGGIGWTSCSLAEDPQFSEFDNYLDVDSIKVNGITIFEEEVPASGWKLIDCESSDITELTYEYQFEN